MTIPNHFVRRKERVLLFSPRLLNLNDVVTTSHGNRFHSSQAIWWSNPLCPLLAHILSNVLAMQVKLKDKYIAPTCDISSSRCAIVSSVYVDHGMPMPILGLHLAYARAGPPLGLTSLDIPKRDLNPRS